MRVIGLTGSIAMGKSTAAKMLVEQGLPVFDSDACVHALYSPGGAAVEAIQRIIPEAIQNRGVDRSVLSAAIAKDPTLLKKLEAIVHPLVRAAQAKFLDEARLAGHELVVLDVPLLFETGREKDVDLVMVVSAPADVQLKRALERPGMTPEKLAQLLARQMPDAEKRARADFVVDSGESFAATAAQLAAIVRQLRHA